MHRIIEILSNSACLIFTKTACRLSARLPAIAQNIAFTLARKEPMTASVPTSDGRSSKKMPLTWDVLICIFLGFLLWVGRYWQYKSFGLYEDDLTIIPGAVVMNFSDLFRYIGSYIAHLYGHGRPLSDSFIYLFSNLGWRLHGLQGIYLIGFVLTWINIGLFYALLRRIATFNIAVIASIFYVLYAADTTQAFLTHSLGAQPSILLLLLAFHAYLSNHKIVAYFLVVMILFSYETPFLVFLAAPLLQKKWGTQIIKKFILHAFILIVFLAAVYLLRLQIGEGRVSGLSTQQMLTYPITHSIIGPLVSLGTYLLRPYQAVGGADTTILLAIGLSLILLLAIFHFLKWTFQLDAWQLVRIISTRSRWKELPDEMQSLGKLFIAGFVMLIGAYPLTFTVRAYAISGRDTRVHLAGVVGASLVVACAIALLFTLFRHKKAGWVLSIIISLWVALLVGYGFVIQRDYRLAWQYQRDFWTSLIQLVPDAGPETAILVTPDGLKDIRQMGANTWNLPRILNQLYIMPVNWKNPPRVFRLESQWDQHLVGSDGNFMLNVITVTAPPSLYGEVPSDHVIFIDSSSGELIRQTQPLTIGSASYKLEQIGPPLLPQLSHGLLYSLMIEGSHNP
jgi:hypothetical protein